MIGLMQHHPLTTASLIDHAERNHGAAAIVSRRADGSLERSTWGQVARRARQVAALLFEVGAEPGSRIATLAWNRTPHLELYYGVTAAGMVLHTVNPRLFPEQIRYIVAHGGATILCIDADLLPLLAPVIASLDGIDTVIVLGVAGAPIPSLGSATVVDYDREMAATAPLAAWPPIDENAASSLCYTSGTTGDPKGVLYSHRSTVLHAFAACAADSMALSARDSALVVTPLFHVNAWGLPFAAAMCGAKLVLPGAALDGASLYALLRDEGVTFSLGVPTVWFGLLDYLTTQDALARSELALERVFMGGAAAPRVLIERFRDELDIDVIQAWGMTETSPVATVCRPLACHAGLSGTALVDLQATQGRPVYGVELRIEDEDGRELMRDGREAGILKVRGHWVLDAYQGSPSGSALDPAGWFDTGDVARIDADGFLHLTDRAKDMIKSGGEWISSIDLENAAAAHPAVAEAAVIGVPHPRWQERPVLLMRLHPGRTLAAGEMLDHLAERVARWWLPDAVLVVDDLPHTATGKLLKPVLRARYRDQLSGNPTPPPA